MKLYDSIKIEIARNESEITKLKDYLQERRTQLKKISESDIMEGYDFLYICDFVKDVERITEPMKAADEKIRELIRSGAVLKKLLKKADEENKQKGE